MRRCSFPLVCALSTSMTTDLTFVTDSLKVYQLDNESLLSVRTLVLLPRPVATDSTGLGRDLSNTQRIDLQGPRSFGKLPLTGKARHLGIKQVGGGYLGVAWSTDELVVGTLSSLLTVFTHLAPLEGVHCSR